MLQIVRQRDAGLLERLRIDAFSEMQRWSTIRIKKIDQAPSSNCSIAGIYLPDAVPPEIGVLASLSRARTNFSALHEFGHHLQGFPELVDELGEQPDRGRALEEMASDAFAAKVLIPDDLLRRHLGTGTPTAPQVAALHAAGTASRAAVCVAAARQLESPGHVLLIDDYGIVDFSASYIEFPLRRGLAEGDAEVLKKFANSSARAVDAESRFTYRGGAQGPVLFAQATDMKGYTVVVAVADKAPWRAISLSSRDQQVRLRWHTCERCEYEFQITLRCEQCNQPKCPECDWCDCKIQKERDCHECFLRKPATQFEEGSDICRDCAG